MPDEQVITPEQQSAESEAAFDSGFGEVRGTPPADPPAKEEAVTEQPPVETKVPEAEPVVEPWKAEVESLRSKLGTIDQLDHRFKSFEGRLGKITSSIEQLAAGKAAAAAVAEAPSQAQIEAAAGSSAKWDALKGDFPDWAEAVEERESALEKRLLAKIPQPQPVDLESFKTEINSSLSEQIKQAKAEARQWAYVDFKYPDWEETVTTEQFKSWAAKQPPEIQALAQSDKGRDAVRMLDAFEAAKRKQPSKETQQQRLKSAMTPKGVETVQPQTINDDDAFSAGFAAERGR